jgi:hypothetical protein
MNIGRTEKKTRMGYRIKRTYCCCGKNELIECAALPQQPALEGVTSRELLILISVRARLKGICTREASSRYSSRLQVHLQFRLAYTYLIEFVGNLIGDWWPMHQIS